MKRMMTRAAGVLAAAGLAPLLLTATAHAEADTVHFTAGTFSCAIYGDGTVGCDIAQPARLQYRFLPIPLQTNEIVIDQSWLPAHPTFDGGTPYTLPGGNPQISDVKTGVGTWGPYVEHAGARCDVGFHGSFGCQSKGQGFTVYSGTISA
ncbi:hypothetical protein ACWDO0_19150 [Nocardia rhamnosiphila]|uniref:Secreted protein n=1 Tax=Nocardia rhamnosiphila TaxID=426716 RepID=A0ABV2WZB0_9NOCA|nr:hypothetical protein [Nocardia rhamnosiphila]